MGDIVYVTIESPTTEVLDVAVGGNTVNVVDVDVGPEPLSLEAGIAANAAAISENSDDIDAANALLVGLDSSVDALEQKRILYAGFINRSAAICSEAAPLLDLTPSFAMDVVAGRAYRFVARVRACATIGGAGGGTYFRIVLYMNGNYMTDHYFSCYGVQPYYGGATMDYLWLPTFSGINTFQFRVAYFAGGGTPKQGLIWANTPHYVEDLGLPP